MLIKASKNYQIIFRIIFIIFAIIFWGCFLASHCCTYSCAIYVNILTIWIRKNVFGHWRFNVFVAKNSYKYSKCMTFFAKTVFLVGLNKIENSIVFLKIHKWMKLDVEIVFFYNSNMWLRTTNFSDLRLFHCFLEIFLIYETYPMSKVLYQIIEWN